jgi:hypothetical protein
MSYSSREAYNKWYAKNKDRIRAYKAANMRKYRAADPQKYALQSVKAKRRLRQRLHEIFGDACVLCGFMDRRALTLDHVLKNGASERASIGERGVYLRALRPEFRAEYRILCMNCQFIARA